MSSPPIGRGFSRALRPVYFTRVEVATGLAVQRRLAAGFPAVPDCSSLTQMKGRRQCSGEVA